MAGVRGEIPNLTVRDLLERYRLEVSAGKKGARAEGIRLRAIERSRVALVRLRSLDTPHASDWQKMRLAAVSEPSVRRERNLLNHVFQVAVKEWRWLRKNPFDGVRRPKDSRPKTRVATEDEIAALTKAASPAMRRAIVIALETGMRASEIASNPKVNGRVAHLVDTKNGEARDVPLSGKAMMALADDHHLTAGSISCLFAELCEKLEIEGLTFHCLRRTAATRLSQKLTVFELCNLMGWKDPRIALKFYYKNQLEIVLKKLSE
jgi:integrase